MRKYLTGLTLLLLVLLGACATSPTGRTQLMLVSERQAMSASREAYFKTMGPLKKEGKLNSDARTRDRVEGITGRLVAQAVLMRPDSAGWEWSIGVIDDDKTVNAWCMAGGRMAIYTGLLSQVDPTDDELAQVLGHEIAHALANHTAEKMSVAMASQMGVMVVGAASDRPGVAMGAAAAAAALAIQLPNSRTAESEADRIGMELAARAGYAPEAAVSLWEKMGRVGGGKRPPEFLSTHPDPSSRSRQLRELAPGMTGYYKAPGQRPVHPLKDPAGPGPG